LGTACIEKSVEWVYGRCRGLAEWITVPVNFTATLFKFFCSVAVYRVSQRGTKRIHSSFDRSDIWSSCLKDSWWDKVYGRVVLNSERFYRWVLAEAEGFLALDVHRQNREKDRKAETNCGSPTRSSGLYVSSQDDTA
jgi:hypothetical protein